MGREGPTPPTLLEEEEGVEAGEDLEAGLVDGADDAAPRARQPLQEAHHQEGGAGVQAGGRLRFLFARVCASV